MWDMTTERDHTYLASYLSREAAALALVMQHGRWTLCMVGVKTSGVSVFLSRLSVLLTSHSTAKESLALEYVHSPTQCLQAVRTQPSPSQLHWCIVTTLADNQESCPRPRKSQTRRKRAVNQAYSSSRAHPQDTDAQLRA